MTKLIIGIFVLLGICDACARLFNARKWPTRPAGDATMGHHYQRDMIFNGFFNMKD